MKTPKKPTKLRAPKLPEAVSQRLKRTDKTEKKVNDALSNVPRITNDTIADHREEVLHSARKYIYPLQQAKHRVVQVSVGLFISVVVAFFAYCGLSLYKFQATSRFIYAVTQVIPFPVAKAGDRWVSYESYLFELRRNMHYYETQQQANFKTKDGHVQLDRLKRQAIDQVIRDAYVKELADQNQVTVKSTDVDEQLSVVRSENRLGSNDRVFKEVLQEFWNWDENDFKRELKQQLLQQAVVGKLDTQTQSKAAQANDELKKGADFAAVVAKYSDDAGTKGSGGAYVQPILPSDRNLAPALTQELAKLKANQTSGVIDAGYSLEIVKLTDRSSTGAMRAAHVQFTLRPIEDFVRPLQNKHPSRGFIKLAPVQAQAQTTPTATPPQQ